MNFLKKLDLYLFVFAALWSIGASLYLLLTPVTIHEITAEGTVNGSQAVEETVKQVSWYAVQGALGIAVLVIFALLYVLPAVFAVRGQRLALVVSSIVAILITLLAGLSIGPLYLPAALAVIAGWLVTGLTRVFQGNQATPG